MALQHSLLGLTGELTALVGIEDPGLDPSFQRFLQALYTKDFTQAVTQFSGQDITACPVHHNGLLCSSLFHRLLTL